MKMRLDFVTNSSSSSYLIAIHQDFEFPSEMMRKYADNSIVVAALENLEEDFNLLIDTTRNGHSYDSDYSIEIYDKQHKINYKFKTEAKFWCGPDVAPKNVQEALECAGLEGLTESYNEWTKLRTEGMVIYKIDTDYRNSIIRQKLRVLSKHGLIKLLEGSDL